MTAVDEELTAFLRRVRACRICRDAPLGGPSRMLPHEPRPVCEASSVAPILIAGQAPGTRVHASGRPFTDPSGVRLRQWLGVDEASFYDLRNFAVAPMGFCFPGLDAKGSDLPPRRECAPTWRADLMRRMPQIRLVVAIGSHAQAWHLGALKRRTLTETVMDWKAILEATDRTTPVFAVPHPSWRNSGWLKRHPFFEAEVVPELQRRVAALLER
ncbi:uracil-DNA glycosylase family protein [Pseudohoeflea coraliihabitans]|uniref:Uracil-DNA glycosylase family protein n=1 Tax=Pseudohoeflea coraliihabitans TaxID=2860393 RepID=A0ABS6WPV2_9HYPH|nr:uracil-DNA glycosylase family protein [Pseudohoeflea sp. DP4N28-3]MBW3097996.1 uracil-DNA glycosylase family protein [Pseudohoeflea sp. DP4N28-3]